MRKAPVARAAAIALGQSAERIFHRTRRGMATVEEIADEVELETALVGRTGNLRAPVLHVGGVLVAGFDSETYTRVLAESG